MFFRQLTPITTMLLSAFVLFLSTPTLAINCEQNEQLIIAAKSSLTGKALIKQLRKINRYCYSKSSFIELANALDNTGKHAKADDVLNDSFQMLDKLEHGDIIILQARRALVRQNYCQATGYYNKASELLSEQDKQNNEYQTLVVQYESMRNNRVITAKEISCAVEASRGFKVTPKLSLQINFDFNSAVINFSGKSQLVELQKALENTQFSTIQLIGHTDVVGDYSYNQNLSEKRAFSVKTALINYNQTWFKSINTKGVGESAPLSFGLGERDHKINRRVEVIFK